MATKRGKATPKAPVKRAGRALFKTPFPGEELLPPGPEVPDSEFNAWAKAELERLSIISDLPHLYGFKWYPWAAEFRDTRNQIALLCAANQISKSSTQIRTCILWATDQDLWKELWPGERNGPNQFWYLYPTQKQVNAEFQTKWLQFLPRGEYKDDEFFGWTLEKDKKDIIAIHFKSGVSVFFKTYKQSEEALQTGSCHAVFCDEELPMRHFNELMFRITATVGYFRMVFTATIGQEEWRLAMEPDEDEIAAGKEFLPQAHKMTVSLYDSMHYEDGSNSPWTIEKIKAVEARCSTHDEVLKRVHGKFIVIAGRKYPTFDMKRHMKPAHPVPKHWLIYAGADIGGGGEEDEDGDGRSKNHGKAHKSALCYVAVSPDFRQGRVFLGWRGDGVVTTAGDVVQKHIEIAGKYNFTERRYDWGNKDFDTISQRMGHPFLKAEKSHERGEEVINTLFKNDMIAIYEDPELSKLARELSSLKKTGDKRRAKDDFADAFRYCVTTIPWDFSFILGNVTDEEVQAAREAVELNLTPLQIEIRDRREAFTQQADEESQRIEDEFEEWNDAYG